MAINTGHLATITLAGSSFVANVLSIKGPTLKRVIVDSSDLESTAIMESLQGDLTDFSELEVEFNWDDVTGGPDITDAAGSIVLTWPIGAQTSAADLTGTGFITEMTYPSFETDTLQKGSAKLKFDGITGPAYTPAVVPV